MTIAAARGFINSPVLPEWARKTMLNCVKRDHEESKKLLNLMLEILEGYHREVKEIADADVDNTGADCLPVASATDGVDSPALRWDFARRSG